jgi:hypothetical protein
VKRFATTLKTAFAVVLVCFAYVVRAHAYQVGQYNCVEGFGVCQSDVTATFSECMGQCYEYHQGGDETQDVCYVSVEYVEWSDGYLIEDASQTCAQVNENLYGCAQACTDNYQQSMGTCLSTYCTYQG